ncbi:MAG: hypothetical protein HYS56_03360 [Candidatus Omnitrophica bacterium]|nr:hypothetical protein [Candidatus Omnitrophota bacterium]
MGRLGSKFKIVKELLVFAKENKKWWLFPAVLVVLVFGLLILFAQQSAVAPFIYALF